MLARTGLATVTAALGAAGVRRALGTSPPGGRERWERPNHAGRPVSLLEGPAWAAGAVAGLLAAGSPGGPAGSAGRPAGRGGALPAAGLVTGAALLGALDDHVGTTAVKGLRGHLTALRHGRVTTGAIKVVGLAAVGLAGAASLDVDPVPGGPARDVIRPPSRILSVLVGGAVVAASANLVNLFDLRPGRALKVVLLTAPLAGASRRGAPLAGAATGASLALLPGDLAGRDMLGDTGANAAGALLGAAVVAGTGPWGRTAVLAGLTALVLASERVSFTEVIARTPWLDAVDRWGRPT